MAKRVKVTGKLLEELRASCSEVERFKREFPQGAAITLANCLKAARLEFDIDWFARYYFKAPAWKAHKEAVAQARKAYDEAVAQARKAYDEAVAPARKAYDEAVAPAWKAYDEAVAQAFYNAYLIQASKER